MVDVEFKIISIGEIKEASMVRDKSTIGWKGFWYQTSELRI